MTLLRKKEVTKLAGILCFLYYTRQKEPEKIQITDLCQLSELLLGIEYWSSRTMHQSVMLMNIWVPLCLKNYMEVKLED